ncbi:MAG: ATP-binding protein, partial [Achromobacter veterisilvae]
DLSVSMARARYQGQDVLVTAFVDVTAKKRVEQQLRKARQAADSANAAKSAFLAAMSHEIRTPLNAILGNLELLSHSPLNAAQRDRLDTIRSASDGLLSVVSDVLDFSKIEAGELRLEEIEFDALEVASRALRMFAPMAQACGLALVGELGLAVSQPMRGDPTRLGQILHNLLSNAIKFTNAGKVTLRLALDEAGLQAAFEVEDTGIGMSAEQMARLFRAFSQGDATISRRFGGTGLGLALCSRLAQAMGGTMAAESEPGLGSRFTLRLPLGECAGERDLPRFDGQSVVLVAAFEAERAYVGQALSAWGLRPQGYGHPAQVGQRELEGAAALVLWGARQTWLAADENRLIEESAWVIDCAMSGPGLPTAAGRLLSVSMYGLGGLAGALRHALQGRALAPASPGRRVLARPLRILVAEDNLVNRRLFEEQLALLGCEVRTAEDGEAALAWLEREEYDVLLTDLAMPGMDGYALARRALRRWPSLPVVAATAHVTPQERERCAQAGMARVLGKPLSLEELGRTLSELTGIAWESPAATGSAEDLKDGQAILDALRQTFLQSCKASLETLRHAQAQGDTAQLLAELHSLGGALNVFRVHDVARDCSELDQAVRQTGIAANATAIDRLCDALRQMEQHLPPGT